MTVTLNLPLKGLSYQGLDLTISLSSLNKSGSLLTVGLSIPMLPVTCAGT